MNRFCIKCPTCGHPVEAELYNRGDEAVPCDVCKTKITVHALPALYKPQEKSGDAVPAGLDDAVCFYHEGKKAEQVCDDCGRFLCGLCVLPIEEESLCASCLEQRRKGEGVRSLKPREMRYDKMALLLAIVSILLMVPFWFMAIVPLGLALAGIYVCIKYWNKKPDLARGFRSRMILSLIISLGGSIGSVLVAIFLFRSIIYD